MRFVSSHKHVLRGFFSPSLTNEDEEDSKRDDVPVWLEEVLSGKRVAELILQLLLQVIVLHRSEHSVNTEQSGLSG